MVPTLGLIDIERPPRDVWADERVVVRRSPISGEGLFADRRIAASTVVVRLGGRLVSSADLRMLITSAAADPGSSYIDTITVYDDLHLVMPPRSVAHFANHSCDPTLWHVGPYQLATRRDVHPGGELTIDYGTSSGATGFVMDCTCVAAGCRRRVTSQDWRRADLQARYDGHWTPALQGRIDRG